MSAIKRPANVSYRLSNDADIPNKIPSIVRRAKESQAEAFESVHVEFEKFLHPIQEENVHALFTEIGKIKTHKLTVSGGKIPGFSLARALQQNPSLSSLVFQGVSIEGFERDILHLTKTISEHSKELRFVILNRSTVSSLRISGPATEHLFWGLAKTLSQCPKIEEVHMVIDICRAWQQLPPLEMCNNPLLKSLEVYVHIRSISDNPQRGMEHEVAEWIELLTNSCPNCGLQQLHIPHCYYRFYLQDPVAETINDFLQTNSTLEQLTLPVMNARFLTGLLPSLKSQNRTLKHLTLNARFLTSRILLRKDVVAMLEQNNILQTLRLMDERSTACGKQVSEYLLLNRAGRAKLGEHMERSDWVDAIATCARNASALYFFLRRNPSLLVDCTVPTIDATSCKPKKKKQKRRR